MRVAILGAGADRPRLGGAALLARLRRGRVVEVGCRYRADARRASRSSPRSAISGAFHPGVADRADEAIDGANVVVVAVPAWGHRAVFDEIAATREARPRHHHQFAYVVRRVLPRRRSAPSAVSTCRSPLSARPSPRAGAPLRGGVRVTNVREKVDVAARAGVRHRQASPRSAATCSATVSSCATTCSQSRSAISIRRTTWRRRSELHPGRAGGGVGELGDAHRRRGST